MWLALLSNPIFRYVAGTIAVVLALYGYGQIQFHRGGKECRQDMQTKIMLQENTTRVVMQRAIRELENLNQRLEERELQLERLSEAANSDPDAGRRAIGAPSVRRLNNLR